jgi:hypothetical protein
MTGVSRIDMVKIYIYIYIYIWVLCVRGGLSYNIVNGIISSDMTGIAKQYRQQGITNVLSITAATYT